MTILLHFFLVGGLNFVFILEGFIFENIWSVRVEKLDMSQGNRWRMKKRQTMGAIGRRDGSLLQIELETEKF